MESILLIIFIFMAFCKPLKTYAKFDATQSVCSGFNVSDNPCYSPVSTTMYLSVPVGSMCLSATVV